MRTRIRTIRRATSVALLIQVIGAISISAQQTASWRLVGDTSGAPWGCSAALGIRALNAWFAAFAAADSAGLDQATAPRFVFSTGRFKESEPFFVTHTISELLRYAEARKRRNERMSIQQVKFNRWRNGDLQFGPIYVSRSADDLGKATLYGIGKGGYRCAYGISVLNLARRPSFDRVRE